MTKKSKKSKGGPPLMSRPGAYRYYEKYIAPQHANPLVKGRMYTVSDGGAIKGVRFNKNGTTDVLVVPGVQKKKRANTRRRSNPVYVVWPSGYATASLASAKKRAKAEAKDGSDSYVERTDTEKVMARYKRNSARRRNASHRKRVAPRKTNRKRAAKKKK